MSIKTVHRVVYYAETARRHFMTRDAAIKAEARALIKNKYPTEESENDGRGNCTYPGFYWRQLPNSDTLYRRMCTAIKRAVDNEAKQP